MNIISIYAKLLVCIYDLIAPSFDFKPKYKYDNLLEIPNFFNLEKDDLLLKTCKI